MRTTYDSRPSAKSHFLAQVYSVLTIAIMLTGASTAFACLGGPKVAFGGKTLPLAVATALAHPFLMVFGFLGLIILTAILRRVRGLGLVVMGLVSVFSGVFIAPVVYLTQLKANAGGTFSPQPVLHAFLLTTVAFIGLSIYALVSNKDFSPWGGMLTIGLFVLIGAGILNIFVGGTALGLALSSVAVLLFGAFVLYDTSRMLRESEDDVVDCAMKLYLNFLNLFINLLRLMSAGKAD